MNSYLMHNGISIRLRSDVWDVPVGATVPYTQFTPFVELDDAKAFIDAGRVLGDHVVYDMTTQLPVIR